MMSSGILSGIPQNTVNAALTRETVFGQNGPGFGAINLEKQCIADDPTSKICAVRNGNNAQELEERVKRWRNTIYHKNDVIPEESQDQNFAKEADISLRVYSGNRAVEDIVNLKNNLNNDNGLFKNLIKSITKNLINDSQINYIYNPNNPIQTTQTKYLNLTPDLNQNLANQDAPSPLSNTVLFHLGQRVYRTTREIMISAQKVTREIIKTDEGEFLSEECPLSAMAILNLYDSNNFTGGNGQVIYEPCIKYVKDASEGLHGHYELIKLNNNNNYEIAGQTINFENDDKLHKVTYKIITTGDCIKSDGTSVKLPQLQPNSGLKGYMFKKDTVNLLKITDPIPSMLQQFQQPAIDNRGKLGALAGMAAVWWLNRLANQNSDKSNTYKNYQRKNFDETNFDDDTDESTDDETENENRTEITN
jgi:hypothetical protein